MSKGGGWKPKEVTPTLPSLKTARQFESKEAKTADLSKPLDKASMEVSKLLGVGARDEPLYKNDRERDKYEALAGRAEFSLSDAIVALDAYTGNSESAREIRLAQRGKGGTDRDKEYARDLENLLRWDAMPKPNVEKFRGFRASPEHLQTLIDSSKLKEKFKHDTLYSWTSSLGVGRIFADNELNELPDRTERVIFRTFNKRGVPIEYVTSMTEEFELLTHGKVNYRHLTYRSIDVGGQTYHVFDVEEL